MESPGTCGLSASRGSDIRVGSMATTHMSAEHSRPKVKAKEREAQKAREKARVRTARYRSKAPSGRAQMRIG